RADYDVNLLDMIEEDRVIKGVHDIYGKLYRRKPAHPAGGSRNDPVSDVVTRIGAFLNIPVMIGAVALVHWGRWNFQPSETHPMGGIEFQVVLGLIMLYIVITGNKGTGPVGLRLTVAA
ncbi:MAG: hypothetical protein U9P00_04490, partial [Pseudomonadota bacterium]|nr:hypothetical protein [Pseudomonadota bacterium]